MTVKVKRNFDIGRQSEQFYNEDLIQIYEETKHLPYRKEEHDGEEPKTKFDGALWFDKAEQAIKYYDIYQHRWINIFSKKFQITDQMLNVYLPENPVLGQLWVYNEVLMYFDGKEWQPIKSIQKDESQWSNAVFEDFQIVTPLIPEGSQVITYRDEEVDYSGWTHLVPDPNKWTANPEWMNSDKIVDPVLPTEKDPDAKSQYIIPNLNTDRVFLDHTFDNHYEQVSKVCIQYPTMDVFEKTVTGIHMNPGKLCGIKKRLILIDKINPTIQVPAFNTEFYGFRTGEYTGDLLIESSSQDWGDYIPSGDYIILNYNASQNYDYVLSITYDFTWVKANGAMSLCSPTEVNSSFFLSNLQEPINVHVNGFKLEEPSYTIDKEKQTVTINEDATNVKVSMWSPYKKQFGYIRETDLNGRGIIRLHEKVYAPLVFVGGTLIHPLYGGLEFKDNMIYVPNPSNHGNDGENAYQTDQMKNMQWCVVDLVSDDMDVQYSQYGTVEDSMAYYLAGPEDRFVAPDEMYYAGTLSDTPDERGIYDYILASGRVHGFTGKVIHYDQTKIGRNDGIILFVDGLLVSRDEIIRDHGEGIITLTSAVLTEGQEYVLLRDVDGAIYDSSNMIPAFNIGYVSDTLVYKNGKLLCNVNCVSTLNPEEVEVANGATHNEIKCFIVDEEQGITQWKIYDQYNFTWKDLTERQLEAVQLIASSYENMLMSIRINIDYDKEADEIVVYAFKFANDIAGVIQSGEATFVENDEDDGLPIYKTGANYFGVNQEMLNVFRNGVKLFNGQDYQELADGNTIKLNYQIDVNDKLTYFVEPVEHGYETAKTTVLLNVDNAIQTNVYEIPEDVNTSFYPGRLSVYLNGIRIPDTAWTLLGNKRIMLKFSDYQAIGSTHNYPVEDFVDEYYQTRQITHTQTDIIAIEIRNDFDRKEKTIRLKSNELNELPIQDYDIDRSLLDCPDEVVFYLNGQYAGLSRNGRNDYYLNKYNGCVMFANPDFIEAATKDELKNLFDQSNYDYTAWKIMRHKTSYIPENKNTLTIVWR